MRYFPAVIIMTAFASAPIAWAQSKLLESVKQNPQEAVALCSEFRELNSQGISASSEQALNKVAAKRNLSSLDAEVLSIYVIGLHCPEVN